jgi:hypothetical protein
VRSAVFTSVFAVSLKLSLLAPLACESESVEFASTFLPRCRSFRMLRQGPGVAPQSRRVLQELRQPEQNMGRCDRKDAARSRRYHNSMAVAVPPSGRQSASSLTFA